MQRRSASGVKRTHARTRARVRTRARKGDNLTRSLALGRECNELAISRRRRKARVNCHLAPLTLGPFGWVFLLRENRSGRIRFQAEATRERPDFESTREICSIRI
jgi:hypothetical protein